MEPEISGRGQEVRQEHWEGIFSGDEFPPRGGVGVTENGKAEGCCDQSRVISSSVAALPIDWKGED